jgi:DNA-binding SARP family transcriptional activator/ABC-type branched-subunit amino acid transport system substrate-binding protein/streptogramin lyase
MEFRILGPFEVESDGGLLPVGRRQPRALLAVLLLDANRVVSRDRLVEALWGEAPPERAVDALQVYVSQLRRSLGRDLIVTRPPGYMIHIEEGQLDLERFDLLVSEARRQDAVAAATGLREALSLWRGPPLADLPDTPLLEGERRRLEELRLGALEARTDADLARGEHAALVPELEMLVREHPLRERFRGQLMLSLYRSGRQAEALEVFAQGRRLLADELGLEPSEALKHLQKAILDHDPELAAPTPKARTRADDAVSHAKADEPAGGRRSPAVRRVTERRRLIFLLAAGVLVLAAGIAAAAVEATGTAPTPASGNTVDAIDASGGSVRSLTDVGTTPGNIVVGDGGVWVLNGDDRTISRIDPNTRRVVKTFSLGTTPTDLAAGDGSLWVGNGAKTAGQASFAYTRSVSRIDPASTSVSATTKLPGQPSRSLGLVAGLSGLSLAGDSVWAVDPDGSISRLDAATGRLIARFPVKAATSLAADRTGVWFLTSLPSGEPAVAHIDAKAGRVSQTIPITASGLLDLAAGAGSVWATDPLDGTVWRINPGPHPVTRTIQAGFGVSHIAFGEGAVWAANFLRGTVSRIDPRTNTITTLPVSGTPQGVAVGDGSAWVSVAGGTVTGNLSTTNCSPVESGGQKPSLLIASDLPLQGPTNARLLPAAIEAVLRLHHFTAGRYRIGYQSCDDSTGQEGAFDFFKCAANARAYAADQQVMAVIGPYDSGCAQVEIPILNRAAGGSLPLLSPSNTLPGLTRASLMNIQGEPSTYYPRRTRNYFRVSAADDLEGTADALLAQRLHLQRVYALSDGSTYAQATAARFTATAQKLHLKVIGSTAWNPTSRNDARLAATVAKTGADAVFLAGFPLESGTLIKALRAQSGKRPTLIGADGYLPISDLLKSAGTAALGMYISDSITMNSALGPTGERVLRTLNTNEPTQALSGAYLPETAQLATLVLDAIAHSNGTRNSILDTLRRTHVSDGILGNFSFDTNGDKTPATFTILRITGHTTPGLNNDFQGAAIDRTILVQPNLASP